MPEESTPQTEELSRMQFEMSTDVFNRLESAYAKRCLHGRREIFEAAASLAIALSEETDFVEIKLGKSGMFEVRRKLTSLDPPTGRASKATRLEHGMKPDPQT